MPAPPRPRTPRPPRAPPQHNPSGRAPLGQASTYITGSAYYKVFHMMMEVDGAEVPGSVCTSGTVGGVDGCQRRNSNPTCPHSLALPACQVDLRSRTHLVF